MKGMAMPETKKTKKTKKAKAKIGSYDVRVACRNCGHAYTIKVPCGETVNDFTRNIKCPHCRCSGTYLHRRLMSYVMP